MLLREDNQAVVFALGMLCTSCASWGTSSPTMRHGWRSRSTTSSIRALRGAAERVGPLHGQRLRVADDGAAAVVLGNGANHHQHGLALGGYARAAQAGERHRRLWIDLESIHAFSRQWRGELIWAHPPPSRLLEATGAAAHVCAPHWPGASWYALLSQLSCESVTLPAGSLVRVACDAPERLAAWPITVFRVSIPRERQAGSARLALRVARRLAQGLEQWRRWVASPPRSPGRGRRGRGRPTRRRSPARRPRGHRP